MSTYWAQLALRIQRASATIAHLHSSIAVWFNTIQSIPIRSDPIRCEDNLIIPNALPDALTVAQYPMVLFMQLLQLLLLLLLRY